MSENVIAENQYVKLVSKEDYWVLETPDLVCVLPVFPNGDVLLIEQKRIPVGKRLLELVTGGINVNEDHGIAAVREVKEETGYGVTKTELVGSFYSAPGYITQKAYVYIAYLGDFLGSELEKHEMEFGLKTKRLTPDEVRLFLSKNTSHPYLSVAFSHLSK